MVETERLFAANSRNVATAVDLKLADIHLALRRLTTFDYVTNCSPRGVQFCVLLSISLNLSLLLRSRSHYVFSEDCLCLGLQISLGLAVTIFEQFLR